MARTSGGGGYGDPLKRDPDLVRKDVLDGYVSRKAGEDEYGVILEGDALQVNADATAKRREVQRKDSLCTAAE